MRAELGVHTPRIVSEQLMFDKCVWKHTRSKTTCLIPDLSLTFTHFIYHFVYALFRVISVIRGLH
jgi:hypothetical protein